MKEQLEFRIRKTAKHMAVFALTALAIVIFFILIELIGFVLDTLFFVVIVVTVLTVSFIFSLLYFPMSINLTYVVRIKYLLGREQDVEFMDIEYYDLNTLWPGNLVDLKLKSGKTISFFIEKEHFTYIQEYFEGHGVGYGKG